MSFCAVLIDREKLAEHGNLTESFKEMLLGLYKYHTAVLDISARVQGTEGERSIEGMMESLGVTFQDCLVIADCEETVLQAQEWNTAVIGYEPSPICSEQEEGNGRRIRTQLDMIVEDFDEMDFYFLERMYQRFYHLPWTVIETKRCFLREITLEDLDDLYELYRPKEITRYMQGLYEDRKTEEEYTKAYIDNMYRFYGYGLWIVIEKDTGAMIGRAGLGNLEVEEEVQLELGYMIAKEKQNQGYATEVCRAILDYAREATEFQTIHCLIQKENAASIHLAEKLGFRLDKSVICNGKEMQRYSKILQT